MANFIFVQTTDVSSRDLFCERLLKNGYKNRWPLLTTSDRLVFRIHYETKEFEILMYVYGDYLSVDEFEDLFL